MNQENIERAVMLCGIPRKWKRYAENKIAEIVTQNEIIKTVMDGSELKIYFLHYESVRKVLAEQELVINNEKYLIHLLVTPLTILGISSFINIPDLNNVLKSNDWGVDVYEIRDDAKPRGPQGKLVKTGNYRVLLHRSVNEDSIPKFLKVPHVNIKFEVSLYCRRCLKDGHLNHNCPEPKQNVFPEKPGHSHNSEPISPAVDNITAPNVGNNLKSEGGDVCSFPKVNQEHIVKTKNIKEENFQRKEFQRDKPCFWTGAQRGKEWCYTTFSHKKENGNGNKESKDSLSSVTHSNRYLSSEIPWTSADEEPCSSFSNTETSKILYSTYRPENKTKLEDDVIACCSSCKNWDPELSFENTEINVYHRDCKAVNETSRRASVSSQIAEPLETSITDFDYPRRSERKAFSADERIITGLFNYELKDEFKTNFGETNDIRKENNYADHNNDNLNNWKKGNTGVKNLKTKREGSSEKGHLSEVKSKKFSTKKQEHNLKFSTLIPETLKDKTKDLRILCSKILKPHEFIKDLTLNIDYCIQLLEKIVSFNSGRILLSHQKQFILRLEDNIRIAKLDHSSQHKGINTSLTCARSLEDQNIELRNKRNKICNRKGSANVINVYCNNNNICNHIKSKKLNKKTEKVDRRTSMEESSTFADHEGSSSERITDHANTSSLGSVKVRNEEDQVRNEFTENNRFKPNPKKVQTKVNYSRIKENFQVKKKVNPLRIRIKRRESSSSHLSLNADQSSSLPSTSGTNLGNREESAKNSRSLPIKESSHKNMSKDIRRSSSRLLLNDNQSSSHSALGANQSSPHTAVTIDQPSSILPLNTNQSSSNPSFNADQSSLPSTSGTNLQNRRTSDSDLNKLIYDVEGYSTYSTDKKFQPNFTKISSASKQKCKKKTGKQTGCQISKRNTPGLWKAILKTENVMDRERFLRFLTHVRNLKHPGRIVKIHADSFDQVIKKVEEVLRIFYNSKTNDKLDNEELRILNNLLKRLREHKNCDSCLRR